MNKSDHNLINNDAISDSDLDAQLSDLARSQSFSVSALEQRILAQANQTPQQLVRTSPLRRLHKWFGILSTPSHWMAGGLVAASLALAMILWMPSSELNTSSATEVSEIDLNMHEYWLMEDQLLFENFD